MPPQIPNIYTLGQVEVSTEPLARLQGKLMAERQAEQEAINKYYDKRLSSISPEGIYEIDQPAFQKKIDDLRQYWIDNKNDILKGGIGKANFDSKLNETANWVGLSKQRKQNWLKGNEFRLQNKLGGKSDIDVIGKMELPTDDPKSKKDDGTYWSWTDFGAMVPDFDSNKRNSFHQTIIGDVEPGLEQAIDKKPQKIGDNEYQKRYKLSYTPDQLKFFENEIVNSLASNDVARKDYEKLKADPTSQRFKNLYSVWSKVPWHKGEALDTVEKLAIADFLSVYYDRPMIVQKPYTVTPKTPTTKTTVSSDIRPFLIFPRYEKDIVPLPGGKRGVPKSAVSSEDIRIINAPGKYVPEKNQEYYIVESSGVWRGGDAEDIKIVDEDVVMNSNRIPSDIRDAIKRKSVGGGKRTGASGLTPRKK